MLQQHTPEACNAAIIVPGTDIWSADRPRTPQPFLPFHSSVSAEDLGLLPGARPVRLTERRRQPPSSIRGWFTSPKALGLAPFESLLERDAQTMISVDPQVEAYAVQPHRLTYSIQTRAGVERRQYVPDLVLRMRDGRRVVVEVKAGALAAKPAWASVEAHIRRAYREDHNADFLLITETSIRREPQLSNAQVMLSHYGAPRPEIEIPLLQLLEEEHGPTSIRNLSAVLAQLGITYEQTFTTVMQCAFAGKAVIDSNQAISPASQVWAPSW